MLSAIAAVIVLLPTPPLAEQIAIIFLMDISINISHIIHLLDGHTYKK
jgi:hypothetical protein